MLPNAGLTGSPREGQWSQMENEKESSTQPKPSLSAVLLSGTKPQYFLQDGGHGKITVRAFTCPGLMKALCLSWETILLYPFWAHTCSWDASVGVSG